MPTYEEVLRLARSLHPQDRRRLAKELARSDAPSGGADLPMANVAAPRRHSAGWLKAERGHAVLATETPESDQEIPAGAAAIAGMWKADPDS